MAAQTPLLPNAVVLPSLHHPQERQKSRPRSPSQVHEKPQSQHQQHARSSAPARAKSPVSAAIPVPATVCKKSESPHHGRAKPTTLPVPNTSTPSRNGTAVTEVKPAVEARSRRPEAHVAKPVLAVDQPSVTVKSETEMLQQTSLKVSSVSQKAGNVALLPSTPDKAGITVPRESPYPRSSKSRQRTPPSSGSKKTPTVPSEISTPVSPFGSPPPPNPTPGNMSRLQGLLRSTKRHRTSSSGSEPELVPVVKKLDEIAGYENIIRDSKMGIKLPNRVPDIIPPIRDRNKKDGTNVPVPVIGNNHNDSNSVMSSVAKEMKTPDLIQPFATQMSDALLPQAKSACFPDDLGAVAFPDSEPSGTFVQSHIPAPPITSEEALSSANIQSVGIIDVSTMEEQVEPLENVVSSACSSLPVSEHHHKSEKKKKKKEHKEHKHKDKDRNREERKHKHKHKDKDKDRHKGEKAEGSAPIKITIPKDKISLGSTLEPVAGTGLKLKIQKDRLKGGTDSTDSSPQSAPSGGLKIKISKEVISNFSNSMTGPSGSSSETPSSSRKRDRSSPQSSELVPPPGPPVKAARFSTSSGEQRRSGNTCSIYGKQNGVEHHRRGSHYSAPGGKVVQKLADSHNAYQSKGKSSASSGSQP